MEQTAVSSTTATTVHSFLIRGEASEFGYEGNIVVVTGTSDATRAKAAARKAVKKGRIVWSASDTNVADARRKATRMGRIEHINFDVIDVPLEAAPARSQAKTPSPTPAEIRALRTAEGLSQTTAADVIHSNLRTWQDWEAGVAKMHPGLWELFRLKTLASL